MTTSNGKAMKKLVAVRKDRNDRQEPLDDHRRGLRKLRRQLQPPLRLPTDRPRQHHHPAARLRRADRRPTSGDARSP